MTWSAAIADMDAVLVSDQDGFGEPVTLPAGVVMGVFDLPGMGGSVRERGSSTGERVAIGQQAQPQLLLRDADVGTLKQQDRVSVRGTDYLVVALTPDGTGMTTVELMLPGAEQGPMPEWRRWR